MRKDFPYNTTLTCMNYNLNELNLEYAELKPPHKIQTAPQYHKCKQPALLKGKCEDPTWAKPEYQNRSGSRISEYGKGLHE